MDSRKVLNEFRKLGIRVTVVGDKLLYRPKSATPPELVEALRSHKTQVMAILRAEDFSCWVLEEWRRASIPHWRHSLEESIATGDKEREEYARWMLGEVLLDPEYERPEA